LLVQRVVTVGRGAGNDEVVVAGGQGDVGQARKPLQTPQDAQLVGEAALAPILLPWRCSTN
jgi:hypothetical protein